MLGQTYACTYPLQYYLSLPIFVEFCANSYVTQSVIITKNLLIEYKLYLIQLSFVVRVLFHFICDMICRRDSTQIENR